MRHLPSSTASLALVLAATALSQAPAGINERIRHEGLENSQVMRFQDYLCNHIGHRLTGSDGFALACRWAREEFAKMGLDARLEKWGEWNIAWNRGEWSGRVLEPIALELQVATPAWSAPTKGRIQGELVRIPKTTEEIEAMKPRLREVFVYGPRPRSRSELAKPFADAIAAHPPLGLVQSAKSTGMTDRRHANQIRVFGNDNVARGSWDKRPSVPEIVVRDDQAEQIDKLLDEGKKVVVEFDIRNRFRPGPVELHNVVADLVGSERPDEVVIVCGHLDSWHQAAGATDNGTGTTSTLETARILTAAGARPKRTIRFILWGGEEQGLLGSQGYVRQHRADMDQVSAVFNHDTGTNWAHSLTVTEAMYEDFHAVLDPVMELPPPEEHDGPVFNLRWTKQMSGFGGSDHASFMAAGVPAWAWGLIGRSEYGYGWHSQWDTYDMVIPEYQRHTATVVAMIALGIADLDHLLSREGVVRRGGGGDFGEVFREWYGFDLDAELKVTGVVDGGPAARAGVQKGDKIESVFGDPVESFVDLYRAWRSHQSEELMTFVCRRGEQSLKLETKTTGPPPKQATPANGDSAQPQPAGKAGEGRGRAPMAL